MATAQNTEENTEQPQQTEDKKYTLLKNIKYGDNVYKLGQKIDIKKKDIDEFEKAGVIKIE